MRLRIKLIALLALAMVAAACGGADTGSGTSGAGTEVDLGELTTIKLVTNTWEGSEANIAVAKAVLEEVGYTVEVVALDENAMWPSMAAGDVHAALEVWPSGHAANVTTYIESGAGVENLGELGVVGKIGWFVPSYVVEANPALATWEGFADPANAAMFATAETGDNGQFLAGDPAFVQYDAQIIENLGLPFQVVVGGSEQALLSALDSAYAAEEPLLFYFWTPHEAFANYELTQVELPAYSDTCGESAAAGDGGVDCAYPDDVLFKIGWDGLAEQAPAAHAILSNFSYTNQNQIDIMAAAGDDTSIDDAAAAWVEANRTVWEAWLP
jgi:glycine betaine/proline transport system substrate-binding protein